MAEEVDACAAGRPRMPDAIEHRPTHYWSWRLLNDGYGWEACQKIRQLDESTLIDHLLRAVEEGLTVRPEWFLIADQREFLEKVVRCPSSRRRLPTVDELPPNIPPRTRAALLEAWGQVLILNF